ncbi:MAG: putative electron transfer flavoprotein FixA [Coriobacteriaceae bacterium]|jgi:electron transfer flavoprotein beta subunit|nr:putative electron transfer flavoprotein FixA [Coriobacteriaceae bacterium]
MNIVACYKVVPEGQDIITRPDGTLDFSRAVSVLGEYDLCAIEEGVRLAQASGEGSKVCLLSAGAPAIDESKLVKAALSRGPEELCLVLDDRIGAFDAYQTACTLAAALQQTGYDLVLCGEGSSDLYGQQVGSLLGQILGVPTVNAVSNITLQGATLLVERSLETEVEVLELTLPAVLSVTSDINQPRVPQLKDILAAGKKPVTRLYWEDLSFDSETGPADALEVCSTLAPTNVDRKQIVFEDASEASIKGFVAALRKEL